MKVKVKKSKHVIFILLIFIFLAALGHFFVKKAKNEISLQNNVSETASVHFIDVGQGDCELIVDGDKTVLIDCGEVDQSSKVIRYLKRLGIQVLNFFIGTHPHTDHIGGFVDIAKNFKIQNVIIPEIPEKLTPTNSVYAKFLKCLSSRKFNVFKANAGDIFKLNGGELRILGPIGNNYDNLNDFSVISKFVYGNNSFLFCGDAEKAAEKNLLSSNQNLKSDVFKLSHHGSNTSNTKNFLQAVGASYGVAEVGQNNSYHHPHKKVLKSLNDFKIQLYRTDLHGNIVFTTNGSSIVDITSSKKTKAA